VEKHPLASDPASANSHSLQLEAYGLYRALTLTDVSGGDELTETTLGGTLLYAGELDGHGRAMVIAGNVSGCGTLAATADVSAQKQAVRNGAVDFLVSSLDEALRILKNEIRKRAAVAVCVGAAHVAVESEMIERGVLPDLVFAGVPGEERRMPHFGVGSRQIRCAAPDSNYAFVAWQLAQAPARWTAKLDEIALDCLASDWRAQRWIRLSPRYCGRSSLAQRAFYCDPESAEQIVTRFAEKVRGGEIETEVVASLLIDGETRVFRLSPVAAG
jgi:urocanate hydratase